MPRKDRNYTEAMRERDAARLRERYTTDPGFRERKAAYDRASKARIRREDPKRHWLRQNVNVGARQRAQKYGREFSLDWRTMHAPDVCPYLGIALDYNRTTASDNSPSIDRIDNRLGYTNANCEIISRLANMIKSRATSHQLAAIAARLAHLERSSTVKAFRASAHAHITRRAA
jgi:hypothetical protein